MRADRGTECYDFEAGTPLSVARETVRAALADEGLRLLDGTNLTDRIRMVRMRDEAHRLVDRLVVPRWMIVEALPHA